MAGQPPAPMQIESDARRSTVKPGSAARHESLAPEVHRRLSAAAGGGLALGFQLPFGDPARRRAGAGRGQSEAEVNAWVVVAPDDTCVIRIARAEMGQGTHTGLAQLVAEELECDWRKVAIEIDHRRPEPRRASASGATCRPAAAAASAPRRTTSAAAARPRASCCCRRRPTSGRCRWASSPWPNGVITHAASKRSTTYGKVAAAAAKLTPPDPKSIKLKDPKDVEGRRQADEAARHRGQARTAAKIYAIDVKLPGMLNAAIKECPVFGGKLVSYDEAKIAASRACAASVQGERLDRRGRRRHLVARQDGARRAADRLGRGRRREAVERDDRART